LLIVAPEPKLPVELPDIAAAHERISAYIRRTPTMATALAQAPGARVFFKLEFTQHAGSFKSRGAFNNLLSRKVPAAGVTAASGGNQGIAVAQAASASAYSFAVATSIQQKSNG